MGETENVTALKVPRECPLVLLVKVSQSQGRVLGSEEGMLMGSGLLGVRSRGKKG